MVNESGTNNEISMTVLTFTISCILREENNFDGIIERILEITFFFILKQGEDGNNKQSK